MSPLLQPVYRLRLALLTSLVGLALSFAAAAPALGQSGPTLVKDIVPGSASSYAQPFVELNGAAYFINGKSPATQGYPPSQDRVSLWRSDSTAAGTTLVKDLVAPGTSLPTGFIIGVSGGTLYINTYTSQTGSELWKSDGTAAGTAKLLPLGGGVVQQRAGSVTLGGAFYFATTNPHPSSALWRTDGTAAGTQPVSYAGAASSGIFELAHFGNALYFVAGDPAEYGSPVRSLYRSDGTAAGTVKLREFAWELKDLTVVGDTLYFLGDGSLWRSDGSAAGTQAVAADVERVDPAVRFSRSLVGLGSLLVFKGQPAAGGAPGLWRSDGTRAGTFQISAAQPANQGAGGPQLTVAGGLVYFEVPVGPLNRLWRSDGTPSGTFELSSTAIVAPSADPLPFIAYQGKTYFTIFDGEVDSAGNGVPTLWETDGTPQNTRRVPALNPATLSAPTFRRMVGVLNGELFFAGETSELGQELWKLPLAATPGPTCFYRGFTGDGTGAWGTYAQKTYPAGTVFKLLDRSHPDVRGMVFTDPSAVNLLTSEGSSYTAPRQAGYSFGFYSTTRNTATETVGISICVPATTTPTPTPTPAPAACTTRRYTGDGTGGWGVYSRSTYPAGTTFTLVARSASAARGMVFVEAGSVTLLSSVGASYSAPSQAAYNVGFNSSTANTAANWVEIKICTPSGAAAATVEEPSGDQQSAPVAQETRIFLPLTSR